MISCTRCSTLIAPEDPACPHCGTEVARVTTAAPEGPPDLPARYPIQQLLGRGGMGRVYLCRDHDLDVDVAVKVLPPAIAGNPRSLQRIESEAKVAARLRGLPGILSLYGFERHGPSCLLVMEYAAGGSIFDRIRGQGRIPEAGCRRVGAEIADALAQAHGHGVLHRDIKPGNVLLDIHGRVKVSDFGLAHVVEGAYAGTEDAPIEGTPTYMAPEVIRGERVTGLSDLYSLGVMLYEMATGEPPFRGTYREIAAAKTAPGAAPPDPRALRPELSPAFASIVLRLMDRDPERRFPGAAACAAALREGGEGAGAAEAVEAAPLPGGVPVLLPVPREAAPAIAAPASPAGLPEPSPGPAAPPREAARPSRSPAPWIAAAAALAAGIAAFALKPWETGSAPPAANSDPGIGPARPVAVEGILVVTRPRGAVVFVDGIAAGKAESEEGLRLPGVTPGVPHVISAQMEDYEPDEEKGVVWRTGEPRAPVVLRLVPKTGILELQGGRPGARVTLRRDGAILKEITLRADGTLPPEILEAGPYEVEVAAKGFRTWKQAVRVSSGRGAPSKVEMPELGGSLSVDTVPTGATAELDGKPLGITPLRAVPVPPGKHALLLDHADASPEIREVEIRGETHADLGVVELPPQGLLDLSALPEGVTALVEGAEVRGMLRRKPGPVVVTFRRAGSQQQTVEVDLKAGPNPAPALAPWSPIPGKVDLTGLGPEVSFVAAGRGAITPPWSILDAQPGTYNVVYGREGFPLLPLVFVVRSGETFRLPPPDFPQARRASELPRGWVQAIHAGLGWLGRHQGPDGFWECDGFESRCRANRCGGRGNGYYDEGVTGLAVLALLGARGLEGVTADGTAAWRGLEWLVKVQEPRGNYGTMRSNHFVYNHAIATLAVVEGYRATGSPLLRESAKKGLRFIEECRTPSLAWRYAIRSKDNDTSVTVWMVEALRAGSDAGIPVDPGAFAGALAWLEKVTEPEYGRAGYTERGNGPARPEELMDRFPADKSESLTAGAVLGRLACGQRSDGEVVQKGLALCDKSPPTWDQAAGTIDLYYWFLGTRAMVAAGGPRWPRWKEALGRALVENQRAEGADDRLGSWDPMDPWARDGGRVYATALNVLSLEAPWRHGPSFREPASGTALSLASDPPGALVFLNGRLLGTAPLQEAEAPAGTSTLVLVHPEREDLKTEAVVPAFRAVDLGKLVLPPSTAAIDLSDLPRDAVASLDGREVKGKCTLRPGEARLTVARPLFWPQTFPLRAVPGQALRPEPGPWKPTADWTRAAIRGLPAPPAPLPAGFAAPAGTHVQDGRLWWVKDRAEMVLVPAAEATGAEGPPARPAFLVDRHEVTVGQFQAFCKDSGIPMPLQPGGTTSRHPVVNVDLPIVLAYARWAGKRLPTREEWERAAWGKPLASFPSPAPWPWGPYDQFRARNLLGKEDGQPGAAPAGSFPLGMSASGCLDMVGNLAEKVDEGLLMGGSFETAPGDRGPGFGQGALPTAGFRCVVDWKPR